MTEKQPKTIEQSKQVSILTGFVKQLRLVWLLFRDKRVAWWAKMVLPASLIYLVSPIDFMPDVILGLGQLDDLGVILLGMALFVKLCPPNIVSYYLTQLEYDGDFYDDNDETVDTTYRIVGED